MYMYTGVQTTQRNMVRNLNVQEATRWSFTKHIKGLFLKEIMVLFLVESETQNITGSFIKPS